jgi:hypothetical protein
MLSGTAQLEKGIMADCPDDYAFTGGYPTPETAAFRFVTMLR